VIPLRLADHIHALIDLLKQIAQQAEDALQRGVGYLGWLETLKRARLQAH
jgi:hypothetical protein